MTYLLAALFFSLVFIGAAVAIHLTVRAYWAEILAALRGDLGLAVRPAPRHAPGHPLRRRAAA